MPGPDRPAYLFIYFIMKIVQVVHTEEKKQTNEQTNKHKPKTHTCQ